MAIIATQAKSITPTKLETELSEMDAGVLKDIPAKTSLTLNGSAMTATQIDTQIKSYLSTIQAADTAKQQYQTALVARRDIQLEARDFYLQLKKVIVAFFGAQSAQLADFGLKPAKAKVPRTSAQKLVTAAKAAVTRAARGTMSKKKKAQITPTVGTPMVAVAAEGKQVTPPTVINPALPAGSTPAPSGSGNSAGSTQASSAPQGSAGGSSGASAPAAAGNGATAGSA
ncbi:MAG: hypothetical protein ACYDCL_06135 [Myxococcales bacterium]